MRGCEDKVKKEFKGMVNDFVDIIKKGEEEGGIDLSELFSKYGERLGTVDTAFREVEDDPSSKPKKKGIFG